MKRNKGDGSDKNYLDYIPVKNETMNYSIEDGKVTIDILNKGIFNRIAQKFFKRPEYTHVHLDEMGDFIWPLIDGNRTVYDIAQLVKEHFGEKAEPLYDRLVTYIRTLESYEIINMK